MAPAELQDQLSRDPFEPMRLHLSSGKTVDIRMPGIAWVLGSGLLVFRSPRPMRASAEGYDVINLRLIDKVEQLRNGKQPRKPKRSA